MSQIKDDIAQSLERIRDRIEAACKRVGRNPDTVTLVAVSKKQDVAKMIAYQELLEQSGQVAVLAENYVQEFAEKQPQISGVYQSHLIGTLQTNKAKEAVRLFDVIQSVHSLKLLSELNKEAAKINKKQKVLLQVNISNDSQKSGFSQEFVSNFFVTEYQAYPNIEFLGLMTITRFYEKTEEVRSDYRLFRLLGDEVVRKSRYAFPGDLILSMGMSDDFEIAIEEGANWIRVGTALFGKRI